MAVEELSTLRRRVRRLPPNAEIAAELLAQALASGHYLKTPADEQCPAGVWMLVPLDRRLVEILDLAGEQHADLEDDTDDEGLADDDEPSARDGDLDVSTVCVASEEDFTHPVLGRFHRL